MDKEKLEALEIYMQILENNFVKNSVLVAILQENIDATQNVIRKFNNFVENLK